MEKTVPVWVVSEFASLSSDNINEDIKNSVRDYVEGEYGGDNELDEYEDSLDALSTKPENYRLEGHEMTVGDVLEAIDDAYNILIDINSQLISEGLDADDVDNMSGEEVKNIIDSTSIDGLKFHLDRMPDEVKSMFARHHGDGIGGRGNEPSIGPAGDAMKSLYLDEML